MDVPAGVTQEEGHTGFFIHLLSAVRALIFLARRIQPFLSLVDCEVEFCVLRPLLMLSQNVVLFCQKETTDKKNTSYAVLKGHFWITEKGTTLLDSLILSFFAELCDRIGLS